MNKYIVSQCSLFNKDLTNIILNYIEPEDYDLKRDTLITRYLTTYLWCDVNGNVIPKMRLQLRELHINLHLANIVNLTENLTTIYIKNHVCTHVCNYNEDIRISCHCHNYLDPKKIEERLFYTALVIKQEF